MQSTGTVPEWTLADRLRKARESTGLDQSEFAERVGISRTSVGNAERGDKTPRRITVRMWAIATGVDLHWLETGQAPAEPGPDGGERAQRDSNPQPSDWEFVSRIAARKRQLEGAGLASLPVAA